MDQEQFGKVRKEILVQIIFFFGVFRSLMISGFRVVFCASSWLTALGTCEWNLGSVFVEMVLLTAAILLLVLELRWDKDWKGYWQSCRNNWLVLGFVALAGLSMIWSIQYEVTFYKFVVLLASTMMAIYIGFIFRLEELIKSLSLFYVLISVFTFLNVFLNPDNSIMSTQYHFGSWAGIFIHRNFLGCFMALGISLFMINLLSQKKWRSKEFVYNLVMLAITLFLLIKSRSATGIITALVLAACIVLLYCWLKWGQKLKTMHYLGFLSAALVAMIALLININFFLGLFGRSASLTGRVPLWQYLFEHVISQRPWLGYGYGAIWHLWDFMFELAHEVGWSIAVTLGDNGFIDILIHLGFVGISFLLLLLIFGFIRGTCYFLKKRTMIAAFPIVVLIFGVVANISLSLILEVETLVWIIAVSCLASLGNKASIKPPIMSGDQSG